MELSIVTTMYKSSPYLVEFYQRMTAAANKLTEDYEIIFVDDGSPDNSLEVVLDFFNKDSKIKIIELSRNFGHHKAIMTGLVHASGSLVFLIDSDLEEEPEWLPLFARKMEEDGCDVVYGVQATRKGSFQERFWGMCAYQIYKLLFSIDHPQNIVTARLMNSDYVKALLLHEEREVCISGLWHITGFDQKEHVVRKHSKSPTTYSTILKLKAFVNAITSFSNAPLKFIFYIGMFITFVSLVYISIILLQWTFYNRPFAGWPSLIASIWLLGGVTIFFIGIIGIYLAKIFSETKRRPYTIVRKVYKQ